MYMKNRPLGDFSLSPAISLAYCVKWLISYTFCHSPRKEDLTHNLFPNAYPMNKANIVEKVQEVLGGTKADADRAVECVIDSIVDGLKSGDEVSIAGLGIFTAKARPARTG